MKIIKTANWYKKAQEYDPFKIDWNREEERAKRMTDEELQYSIKDAYEAAQAGMNEGKYMDQISVYRQELNRRKNILKPQRGKTEEELEYAIKDAQEAIELGINKEKYLDQIKNYQQELNKIRNNF
ncbi:MAG TPA: hypothetical protein VMZ91_05035 [Candidatus Paceibacterota bacterium]|nr:hypothetical protein [Candidatus Paceibacterota bacterium]